MSENIADINSNIHSLEFSIRDLESEILTQKGLVEQAITDNEEKDKFNKAAEAIKLFNPNRLCSVLIERETVKKVFNSIDELQQIMNSNNISAVELQKHLNVLESRLDIQVARLNHYKELKRTYQEQIRAQIQRLTDELAELNRLVDDMDV